MPIKQKRASVNSTIIFFDVVGYSKKDENTQFMIVNHMNDVVKKYFLNEDRFNENSENFKTFSKIIDNDEIFIPGLFSTGDGFLIVLDHNTTSPILLCEYALIAINFSKHLINEANKKEYKYNVRIGINQGRVISYDNINGISFAGDALNDTQRIMDLGDDNHILLSKDVYDNLEVNRCKKSKMEFKGYYHVPVKNKELDIFQLIKLDKYDNYKVPSKIVHLQTGKSINEKTPIDVTNNKDYVHYIDNSKVSEDIFIFLSGIGLDHYDFEKIVFLMGKRAIAFTLPGLERYSVQEYKDEIQYKFNQYVEIAFAFINHVKFREDFKDKRINLIGFSMGADIFHKIIAQKDLPKNFCKAILLDANHGNLEEMFITKVLMSEKPEEELIKNNMNNKEFDFKDDVRSLRYLYDVFSKEQVNKKQIKTLAESYYTYINDTINSNNEISFNDKNKIISEKKISVIFLFRDGFTTSHIKNKPKDEKHISINKKNLIEIGLNYNEKRTDYFDESDYNWKEDKSIIKYEHITFYSGYNCENKLGHFDLIEYEFLIEYLNMKKEERKCI